VKSVLYDQDFIIMHHDNKKYFSFRMHVEDIVFSSLARWYIFDPLDMLYIFYCSLSALNYCKELLGCETSQQNICWGVKVLRDIF